MTAERARIGVIGARGHTGRELLAMILAHPRFELVFAGSRQLQGQPLSALDASLDSPLKFQTVDAAAVHAIAADALVLALPNNMAADYVAGIAADCVVLDLSADHRFDAGWYYGLPELTRGQARGQTRIANPGCYATAMQLGIAPVLAELDAAPVCFGVSGYSGAGTQPSERNDPAVLADNLLPYQPVGHVHEREVSHRLGQPVRFMPHVAAFFRGISMTLALTLNKPMDRAELMGRYYECYAREALIKLSDSIPRVADNALRHHAAIGGFEMGADGRTAVLYVTLDNLLKGAATQAIQNLNNAFGFAELEGIPHG